MAHSPKDALIAAKEDLLAAYNAVHTSLGRLISVVHNSEPRAIASALGSEYELHSQSPSQNHYPVPPAVHSHRSSQSIETSKYSNIAPLYPAPPQPQSSTHPRVHPPPGPSFMTVTPGAPRQMNYAPMQSQKVRQRKAQLPPPGHSYALQSAPSQPAQPLETDDEEDEDDDAEEPVSEEDHHLNGSNSAFYIAPPQQTTIPTPPGSIPGAKRKRVKRERDPNAPKRPASAYILFQNAVRQEMRAANPTADYKELARQIGDRWKNLSEDDKRPWSEAGKMAMSKWNMKNKEYKISHPETISPHHQGNGNQVPVVQKRRSRVVELDQFGNRLPKKRGRPSKLDKDPATEPHVHPGPYGDPPRLHPSNGDPAHPSTMANVHGQINHAAVSQLQGPEYSEEDEEEDEEEEEEEAEVNSHTQAAPASFQQANGTSQLSSHMAPTDSDMDDGEEDEGSAASTNEPHSHVNIQMEVQPNAILA